MVVNQSINHSNKCLLLNFQNKAGHILISIIKALTPVVGSKMENASDCDKMDWIWVNGKVKRSGKTETW